MNSLTQYIRRHMVNPIMSGILDTVKSSQNEMTDIRGTFDLIMEKINNMPYDIPFVAGFDDEVENTELEVKSYNTMMVSREIKIKDVYFHLEENPVDGNVIFDILRKQPNSPNWESIFINNGFPEMMPDGSKRAGSLVSEAKFLEGDLIEFTIRSVGLTEPGKGLRVSVKGIS